MSNDKKTTETGFINKNGQVVIRNTGKPGTDHLQYIYQMACGNCGEIYGANGSDVWDKKCPKCGGGELSLDWK